MLFFVYVRVGVILSFLGLYYCKLSQLLHQEGGFYLEVSLGDQTEKWRRRRQEKGDYAAAAAAAALWDMLHG